MHELAGKLATSNINNPMATEPKKKQSFLLSSGCVRPKNQQKVGALTKRGTGKHSLYGSGIHSFLAPGVPLVSK